MTLKRRSLLTQAATIACALPFATQAFAQEAWPARPVKIIVPGGAGSSPDRVTRMLAERLSKVWGQPVLVDNKVGGTTIIGTDAVAKSPADGYTLLSAYTPFVQVPSLFKKLPYDAERDFAPIIQTVESEVLFLVRADSPWRTMREFVAAAKTANPTMSYGSFGNGSTFHIYGEKLKKDMGMDLIHVPYKAEVPPITDTLGGQLQSTFGSVGTSIPFIRAGRLRALGIVSTRRSKVLPDVPTFGEIGSPPPDVTGWFGMMAPAATPQPIVRKIAADIKDIMSQPDVIALLREQGLEPMASTSEAFRDRIGKDIATWRKLLPEVGVNPAD